MNEPQVTPELLAYLDELFPDTVPGGDDPADWHRKQGEQRVVRKLRQIAAKQDPRR